MAPSVPEWEDLPVVILGDVMLDRFVTGEVHRISPEAPIPVVDVQGETTALGGAANVARNIHALGGRPVLLGVVGEDTRGDVFVEELRAQGIEASDIIRDPDRVTTMKTRIIAHHQQIVRVDRESKSTLTPPVMTRLLTRLDERLPDARALVVSDYAKGILEMDLLGEIGRRCQQAGVPYVADPKPVHFPYPGATVATPNRSETARIFGRAFEYREAGEVAAAILERTDWEAVLLTLGERGMVLAERKGEPVPIPARVREVFDVTGAGDTVVAVLSLGLAAGGSFLDAAELANAAAGVVVGKVGTAACSPEELLEALEAGPAPAGP